MKIGIYLGRSPMDCRVIIDGQDISKYCRGVELRAHVNEGLTIVGLDLQPLSVEVLGEAGELVRSIYQTTEQEPESTDCDAQLREFAGWLSGDIPELHSVEIPRLAESLDRFLQKVRTPE